MTFASQIGKHGLCLALGALGVRCPGRLHRQGKGPRATRPGLRLGVRERQAGRRTETRQALALENACDEVTSRTRQREKWW